MGRKDIFEERFSLEIDSKNKVTRPVALFSTIVLELVLMVNTATKICDRIIKYSFYLLFALVPLIFTPFNFELFEFNKMWVTFILSIVITASWFIKMVISGQIKIQRTPLDIPLLLFLAANMLSTIFSIDVHTSIWGYYSRFNGSLLSIISYILLYYVFINNLNNKEEVIKILIISFITGAFIALYGVLEHFGIDAQYWVQDVKNRVFSTLGQPNWLAAYLSVLIPIAIALGLVNSKRTLLTSSFYLLVSSLFYLALLYTKSRSGFLGLGTGIVFLFTIYFWHNRQSFPNITLKKFINLHRYILAVFIALSLLTFIVGSPFEKFNQFTFEGVKNRLTTQTGLAASEVPLQRGGVGPALETGGTESGEIRKIVWKGAIDIARAYPLFGSGVETFAFAYYKFRPAAHNLTSEWDFLYNKAHNEYLNYAATTGFVGLAAYLGIILTFIVVCIKRKILNTDYLLLPTSLVAGYISILVSNFFGFSVVIINLYFFLIPAMVFITSGVLDPKKIFVLRLFKNSSKPSTIQLINIAVVIFIAYYLLLNLTLFWLADVFYARGYNLDRAGQFEKGYQYLISAVEKRSDEPVFREELASNMAILATAFHAQDQASTAAKLVDQSILTSREVVKKHPNNVTFWKSQARMFYTLSAIDEKYLSDALIALQQASLLTPTDAKISYNLGLLYGQTEQPGLAIKTLEETIRLKPNYRDAYFALGLFYDEKEERQKAIEAMDYILKNIASTDAEATQQLLEWRGY